MIKSVVFDFGNVIIDWDPYGALNQLFDSREEMARKLSEVDFYDWNNRLDGGESIEFALSWAKQVHPNDYRIFETYWSGLEAAHDALVPGTSELIERLNARGIALFGLTNASMEAVEAAKAVAPVIGLMKDVVVSAEEKLLKPDAAIYRVLLERNTLIPAETLFVDDRAENCEAAETLGMKAHHFTGAERLADRLEVEGLDLKTARPMM